MKTVKDKYLVVGADFAGYPLKEAVCAHLREKGWKITEEQIREGLRTVTWPGRFDIVSRDPLFIIDGGHNPQCIEALVTNIRDYLADRRVIALVGVLADKDYADMFRPVMELVEQFGEGVDRQALDRIKNAIFETFDFNSRGAATFLGTKKTVVKMHGAANADTAAASIAQILRLEKSHFSAHRQFFCKLPCHHRYL